MADSKSEIVVYQGADQGGLVARRGDGAAAAEVPAVVLAAGGAAGFAWDEFFKGELANAHTRANYLHAVRDFLAWADGQRLDLIQSTPGDVGLYLRVEPNKGT